MLGRRGWPRPYNRFNKETFDIADTVYRPLRRRPGRSGGALPPPVRSDMMAAAGENPPEGLLAHTCTRTADGLVIVDAWESADQWRAMVESERLPKLGFGVRPARAAGRVRRADQRGFRPGETAASSGSARSGKPPARPRPSAPITSTPFRTPLPVSGTPVNAIPVEDGIRWTSLRGPGDDSDHHRGTCREHDPSAYSS